MLLPILPSPGVSSTISQLFHLLHFVSPYPQYMLSPVLSVSSPPLVSLFSFPVLLASYTPPPASVAVFASNLEKRNSACRTPANGLQRAALRHATTRAAAGITGTSTRRLDLPLGPHRLLSVPLLAKTPFRVSSKGGRFSMRMDVKKPKLPTPCVHPPPTPVSAIVANADLITNHQPTSSTRSPVRIITAGLPASTASSCMDDTKLLCIKAPLFGANPTRCPCIPPGVSRFSKREACASREPR